MRFFAGLLVLVGLLLGGCAPYAQAPLGGGTSRTCEWVQERVADGSLPVIEARRWYSHCGPFEVES